MPHPGVDSQVFSTPVEVFPFGPVGPIGPLSLLHARGGVSEHAKALGINVESSPRPWRCF